MKQRFQNTETIWVLCLNHIEVQRPQQEELGNNPIIVAIGPLNLKGQVTRTLFLEAKRV